MKNDLQSIHEQYKRIISEANEEPQYNHNMNRNTSKEDAAKIANVKKFEVQLQKLLDKYPDVKIYGDTDGAVRCHTTLGSGMLTRGYASDKRFKGALIQS